MTCGIFQIHFYGNLFNPNQNSKIQNKAKQKTIEILLNELFVLNEQNETTINDYSNDRGITIT